MRSISALTVAGSIRPGPSLMMLWIPSSPIGDAVGRAVGEAVGAAVGVAVSRGVGDGWGVAVDAAVGVAGSVIVRVGVDVARGAARNMVAHTPTTSTKVENRAVGDMTYSPHAIVSPASTGATARARSSEDERADWVMQGLFVTRAP